jgi:CheY-like chemotaxis protein
MSAKPETGVNQMTEEKREQVRTLLRNTDRFIKEGKLPEARAELTRLRTIDPKNVYASAFEERLTFLEHQKPKDQPAAPAATQTHGPAAEKRTPAGTSAPHTEQVSAAQIDQLRREIENKIESKYKDKFAQEIQKAEERVAKVLSEEEEKRAQERISMLEELKRERGSYQRQLDESFQSRLKDELAGMESQYLKRLEEHGKETEVRVRKEIEGQHAAHLAELRSQTEEEKNRIREELTKSLESARKELDTQYQDRLRGELNKIQESAGLEKKQAIEQMKSQLRSTLQAEFEQQLADERAAIEQKYAAMLAEKEKAYADRLREAAEEKDRAIEKTTLSLKEEERKVFDQEMIALRAQLETEYRTQLDDALARERQQREEEARISLERLQAELQQERRRILEQEQSHLEEIRQQMKAEMQEEYATKLHDAQDEVYSAFEHRMSLLGIEVPHTGDERIAVYKERLKDAWSSGSLTMEKAQRLMELQEVLGIDFETHAEAEAEIRLKLYADIVEEMILTGRLKATDTAKLDELKQRYEITVEEAADLEPLILSAFQRSATRGIILVADDDEALVQIIEMRLKEDGYQVLPATKISQAIEISESSPVDLILCDIRFEGEKVDGFSFFKMCLQNEKLRKIPFVFMSSLDEGLFIRTGIQLGVDDYLTKPLDIDLLSAVVEGKLKKYRMLRSN